MLTQWFCLAPLVNAYAASIHPSGTSLGISTIAGAPPTQTAGIPVAASQALGTYPGTAPGFAYAAVPGSFNQAQALGGAGTPVTYAHLTAQLQQQMTDRF